MNRYVVTSLTGIVINDESHYVLPGDGPKPSTEFYILDRFQAFKVCAVFSHKNKEETARRTCHEWNAEERQWEKAG